MFEPIPQISDPLSTPACIKGINAYDNLATMQDGYALILRNFFAQPYGCQIRRGYVVHQGPNGDVHTLMAHNTLTPTLWAIVKGSTESVLCDVTEPNEAPIVEFADLTSAIWNHTNFGNAAGVHMIACCDDEAEEPIWFKPDGTVVRIPDTDITGVDPTLLCQVVPHQKRLWFVERNSTRAWYLPPDQLIGAATSFDFGPLMGNGGEVVQLVTWTFDDGAGSDDWLVALTSRGQMIVYQGIDPSSAETWKLKGVYTLGAPVSRRSAINFGGDVVVITSGGVVLVSNAVNSEAIKESETSPGKLIQQLLSSAANLYGDELGWETFFIPMENMLLVNVPVGGNRFNQFAYHLITKGWSEFTGYNGFCWEIHQGRPFFGGQGIVARAWEQNTDGAVIDEFGEVTPGEAITALVQSNFSPLGSPTQQKHLKMIRPYIISQGQFTVRLACNVDFSFGNILESIALLQRDYAQWDQSLWNSNAWAGGLTTYKKWATVEGLGSYMSLKMAIESSAETYWTMTDWLIEKGGVL